MGNGEAAAIVVSMSVSTMRNAAGEVVINIRGEIDATDVDRLRRVVTGASRQRPTAVVVDLLYVTFIDSTGIGALVAGRNTAHALGIPYRVRRPSPFIATQLRQTGLYEVLTAETP